MQYNKLNHHALKCMGFNQVLKMQQAVLIDLCSKLCKLKRDMGYYILNEQKTMTVSSIEEKGRNNYVTHVDKQVDRMLADSLRKLLPQAGIITEESGSTGEEKEYYWVVDPIDGTSNYIRNSGPFCISTALVRNEKPILGVVYELTRNELFYAWEGSKAYLNGMEISCSANRSLTNAMVGFGFSYDSKLIRKFAPLVLKLSETTTTRCQGSAAAEICYVAKGGYEAYIHNDLKIWDYAAAGLILKQAGGGICTMKGSPDYFGKRDIIAYNHLDTQAALLSVV